MKFTKILSLVLAILMIACVFVAKGPIYKEALSNEEIPK